MDDANKYSFSNVLVADTKLHVYLNDSGARQPDVLVLNTKLVTTNKCHKLSSCACCLRVERPEFRRRSSVAVAEPAPECFASCHDRRTMSIELKAQAQLSGKLIILALSRAENLFKGTPKIPFRCQMQTTWSFTKFEPATHLSSETGQVYYSRLEPGQVPSLLIDTLEFHWNPTELKEVVSLTIQSNIHRTHKHQVSMKETLLVAELACRPLTNTLESYAEEQNFPEIRQMQIMTLINREANTSVATTRNSSTRFMSSKRAIASQTSATGSYPKIIAKPQFVDEISARPVTSKPLLPPATTTTPHHQLKVELRNNDHSQMGPPYFADDDAFRLRLKSSGLYVITVSSLFVILTYTLCLLFYLKLRNRVRSKGSLRDTVATLDGMNQAQPPVVQLIKAPDAINISEPFNLQMGEATRTRLDMMLGRRRNKRECEGKKVIKKAGRTAREQSPGAEQFADPSYNHFGSIKVVRAIRHAATLARSTLKGSRSRLRYRPNLHAIPESELEQQQSPRRNLGLKRINCVSPDQLETLVKDALSPNCSHAKEKNLHQQNNATLFARPIDATTNDPVSRTRILKQIKQDDLYEESQIYDQQ